MYIHFLHPQIIILSFLSPFFSLALPSCFGFLVLFSLPLHGHTQQSSNRKICVYGKSSLLQRRAESDRPNNQLNQKKSSIFRQPKGDKVLAGEIDDDYDDTEICAYAYVCPFNKKKFKPNLRYNSFSRLVYNWWFPNATKTSSLRNTQPNSINKGKRGKLLCQINSQ